MSWNNKVVWSEGLFLQPQHFQQHVRYLESFVEGRCSRLRSYSWGFTELKIDHELLSIGKLNISRARGVFPDGTPFNIPDDDEPPLPVEVEEDMRDTVFYLALPTRRSGTLEIDGSGDQEGLARYVPREFEVRDATSHTENSALMQVGTLRMRLLQDSDERDEYACLGMAHVTEARTDKNVVLEESYVAPVLDCQVSTVLGGFVNELHGLLHHRAESLAGRVTASGRGGAAEIADFLLLQMTNRYEPLVAHLAALSGLHPETLYRLLVEIAGEMATFMSSTKRPAEFPPYRHHDLRSSFAPVMAELRKLFESVIETPAISIPLKEKRFGIRVGSVADRSLLDQAMFVLAVSASIATEDLRKRFPTQVKIGAVEQIRELVNVQLPGIRLRALPVAPRQIPFHSGFVYFELDRASEHWQALKQSGGFAIHVGGEFPGLQMEFWAIRS